MLSGGFCESVPVLKSIRLAARTLAVPPVSSVNVTVSTPRSTPPSCVKFVTLRKRLSGTVITSGELVTTLLLNSPAKTKVVAPRIQKATMHRPKRIFIPDDIRDQCLDVKQNVKPPASSLLSDRRFTFSKSTG